MTIATVYILKVPKSRREILLRHRLQTAVPA
jgi:hypothetical protein